MKKFLILCFTLLLSVSIQTSKAQVGYDLINWGPKIGFNTASLSGIDNLEETVKGGLTAGLYFELRPLKFFGVSAEALYSGRFFNGTVTSDTEVVSLEAQMHYLDFPIMLKVYVWNGLSVGTGIMPSIIIDTKLSTSFNECLDVNSSDLSIPINLGYSFSWGLTLDARYKIGLSDVTSYKDITTSSLSNTKSNGFTFMIGWSF